MMVLMSGHYTVGEMMVLINGHKTLIRNDGSNEWSLHSWRNDGSNEWSQDLDIEMMVLMEK